MILLKKLSTMAPMMRGLGHELAVPEQEGDAQRNRTRRIVDRKCHVEDAVAIDMRLIIWIGEIAEEGIAGKNMIGLHVLDSLVALADPILVAGDQEDGDERGDVGANAFKELSFSAIFQLYESGIRSGRRRSNRGGGGGIGLHHDPSGLGMKIQIDKSLERKREPEIVIKECLELFPGGQAPEGKGETLKILLLENLAPVLVGAGLEEFSSTRIGRLECTPDDIELVLADKELEGGANHETLVDKIGARLAITDVEIGCGEKMLDDVEGDALMKEDGEGIVEWEDGIEFGLELALGLDRLQTPRKEAPEGVNKALVIRKKIGGFAAVIVGMTGDEGACAMIEEIAMDESGELHAAEMSGLEEEAEKITEFLCGGVHGLNKSLLRGTRSGKVSDRLDYIGGNGVLIDKTRQERDKEVPAEPSHDIDRIVDDLSSHPDPGTPL